MSEDVSNQGEAIVDAPDWEEIDYDVFCPLCRYNLRGLNLPRCPECGYRFAWTEILDPRRQEHPYLFEHHPDRHIRSYFRTALGACRPRRFWASLHPVQPSRLRWLLLYWCIGAICLLPASFALVVTDAGLMANQVNIRRVKIAGRLDKDAAGKSRIIRQYGSVQAYLDAFWPKQSLSGVLKSMFKSGIRFRSFGSTVVMLAVAMPLVWTFLTFISLLVFQISMRKAKINTVHVMRCVLYSFDMFGWAVLFLVGGLAASILYVTSVIINWNLLQVILFLAGLGLLHGFWRLWSAYKLYLRFDHSFMTVLSSQVIVFMLMLQIIFMVDTWLALDIAHIIIPWIFRF